LKVDERSQERQDHEKEADQGLWTALKQAVEQEREPTSDLWETLGERLDLSKRKPRRIAHVEVAHRTAHGEEYYVLKHLEGDTYLRLDARDYFLNVGAALKIGEGKVTVMGGDIHLIPSSLKAGEIARVLREGCDVSLLNDGFRELIRRLNLDYLFIDTHPGLNEETLLSIAISDVLLIILRPDQQDYQGTAVAEDVVRLASAGIFCLRYPDHPVTQELRRIAARITI
jgi:hypothetical protein